MDLHLAKRFNLVDPDAFGKDVRPLNRVPLTSLIQELGVGHHALDEQINEPVGDERTAVVLDLETTGFSAETDEIIELGAIKFEYSPSLKRLTRIVSCIDYLQQPSQPLKPIITEVTGLTDQMLAGQSIPKDFLKTFMNDADLVIAHNAVFDAKFYVKAFGQLPHGLWACSSKGGDIDWPSFGMKSSSLDLLNSVLGFFYDAHRASVDCMATLWLFIAVPEAFSMLLGSVQKCRYLIRANGAPYSVKDSLRSNGYKWNADDGVWQKEISGDDALQQHMEALMLIYSSAKYQAETTALDNNARFL